MFILNYKIIIFQICSAPPASSPWWHRWWATPSWWAAWPAPHTRRTSCSSWPRTRRWLRVSSARTLCTPTIRRCRAICPRCCPPSLTRWRLFKKKTLEWPESTTWQCPLLCLWSHFHETWEIYSKQYSKTLLLQNFFSLGHCLFKIWMSPLGDTGHKFTYDNCIEICHSSIIYTRNCM